MSRMNTAGSPSSVGQGLDGLWNYDQRRKREMLGKGGGRRPRLRIVAVAMLFAVMGATLAWVFERLSSDIQFMPYGGFTSSSSVSAAEVRLKGK